MAVASGTVEAIKVSKNFTTKYGEKCHLSFKVGEDWFTWQFADPDKLPVSKGDVVEFAYTEETNDKGYTNKLVNKKAFEKKSNGTVANGGSNRNSGNTSPRDGVTTDNRQDSIMRQSSLNYATNLVAATLTSKSNPRDAAQIVLEIADEVFLPYAKYGRVGSDNHTALEAEAERQEQMNQQNHQNQQDEEDFSDDIPF